MTEKGQITLPVAWRREVGGMAVRIRTVGQRIEIIPVQTQEDEETGWTTVFNADRDNGGKGIPIEEFRAALWRAEKSKKTKKLKK